MKPYIVIQGPVATRSGYGAHTRDLVTPLIKSGKYDIEIISLPWGATPMTALDKNDADHQEIIKRIVANNITRKPDLFIQISIPSEFQAPAKYNIGITAGIETDVMSGEFVEGCNKMDLVITTSEHSKKVMIDSVFEKRDQNTNQPIGQIKMEKPIEVLFEGFRTDVYKKLATISGDVKLELSDISEDFCYLFVGHWLQGGMGHDRKDIGMMIKTFCETFKRKPASKRPALILKTSSSKFSIMDRNEIMQKIQAITEPYGKSAPNIYLLHGDLTDKEMNDLYNHPKVKAMVSFTHGEGFGRPLLEFSAIGKPVIASNWSGHVDFLKHAVKLPGELITIDESAVNKWLIKESKWFQVNYAYASQMLADVHDNYKKYQKQAIKQKEFVHANFTYDMMSEQFIEMIDKSLKSVPTEMKLNLPKLKKVKSTEAPKLKLPKLKKVTNEA
jgi:glycosyltransferase involved in cell wall biosynthesis